ncbi:hypothetical protein GPECTOR_445g331 [Gonium pectorale]|uniref:Uncharacterized protein n=1 Tax=Gonium pectorale TaxID=33097 RepID=A0A150FV48_GONPE|nr:hypothetical protein GPECTOR_445g331 [Gonium pectorale]|eukprot:KXZ41477.1 hypothetical protein GPECTOR_445g331 [Gonium pectorale]
MPGDREEPPPAQGAAHDGPDDEPRWFKSRMDAQSAQLDSSMKEFKEGLRTITDTLAKMVTNVDQLNITVAEGTSRLDQHEKRLSAVEAAAGSILYMHPDKLLLRVPTRLTLSQAGSGGRTELEEILAKTLEEKLPRNRVRYELAFRKPKVGVQGAAAAAPETPLQGGGRQGSDEKEIVDMFVHPQQRKTIAAALGKSLGDKGIIVMDALTKAGVELKGKRAKAFALFKTRRQQPRWEQGVQFTYVDDHGERKVYREGDEKKYTHLGAEGSG